MIEHSSSDTIILRITNSHYFFKYLRKYRVSSCYVSNFTIIHKLIRKISSAFNMPCKFIFGDWKFKVREVKRFIIFDYGYDKLITRYIKNINPNCVIHFFAFNTMSDSDIVGIKNDTNIDYIWSFDTKNVDEYGLRYASPMFTINLYEEPNNVPNKEVVFLGAAKNREIMISNIQNEIQKIGVATNFHVIKDSKDYIEYDDYLEMIRKSSCILDITKEGQTGLTLRFMEALFLSKKIITNNVAVMSFPFYNSQNIFIIGVDPIDNLKGFLESDYRPIGNDILTYYDFDSWVQRFIEAENV